MTRRLTAPMRDALQAAAHPEGLRRVHKPGPGKPPWPAHPATIAALLRHHLVEHNTDRDRRGHPRDTWTITDQGRQALEPPRRRRTDRPRFLQRDVWRGGDYTTDPNRRIDELEVLDDHDPHWHGDARLRHTATHDRRAAGRQLARNARGARAA